METVGAAKARMATLPLRMLSLLAAAVFSLGLLLVGGRSAKQGDIALDASDESSNRHQALKPIFWC